MNMPYDNIME
jgi:hypothetical protein